MRFAITSKKGKMKEQLRKEFNKRLKTLKLDEQAKEELFDRFSETYNNGFKCAYCDGRMELKWGDTELAFTIDHVVPRAYGGSDSIGNLTFACQSCNSMKGDKSAGWFVNNVKRLKARKQKREYFKAKKASKKDKRTREAYIDIFKMRMLEGKRM